MPWHCRPPLMAAALVRCDERAPAWSADAAADQAQARAASAGIRGGDLSPFRGRPEEPDRIVETVAGVRRDPAARSGRLQPVLGIRGRRSSIVSADACGIDITHRG